MTNLPEQIRKIGESTVPVKNLHIVQAAMAVRWIATDIEKGRFDLAKKKPPMPAAFFGR